MGRVDLDDLKRNPTHLLLMLKDCGLVHTGSTGWRSRCPLHQGSSLSFAVTKTRSGAVLWHCFVCNEGGSVIDLVQKLDGCSFRQALATLGAPERVERVYAWSAPKVKGRQRTKATVTIPCEVDGCKAELHELLEDVLCVDIGHQAWDFDIHGLGLIWAWCPVHHRANRERAA